MNYFSDHARQLFENGYSIIPLKGKTPCISKWQEFCSRCPTEDEIESWIKLFPDANIGLPGGSANGVVWLDCDAYTVEYAQALINRLPGMEIIRIGAKGFATPVRFTNFKTKLVYRSIPMGDLLGVGRQMAGFGIHPDTAKPYEWRAEKNLFDLTRNELVDRSLNLSDEQLAAVVSELDAVDFDLDPRDHAKHKNGVDVKVGKGGRNNTFVSQVGAAFSKGVAQATVAQEILRYDQRHHAQPLFEDLSEKIEGSTPAERAANFVANIYSSLTADRERTGVALPDIKRESALTVNSKLHQDFTQILPDWYWSKPKKGEDSKPTKPKTTMANVRALLRHMGVTIQYNMVSKIDEIIVPEIVATQDNNTNVSMAHLTSWFEHVGMNTKHLYTYALALADENAYSPIANWIESKDWDGVDRLPDFFKTVTVLGEDDTDDGNKKRVFKKRLLHIWLIQAIAAVFSPRGISAGGMLVFQGDQYLGKTKWFKQLLPPELAAYRADGVTLHTQDKDSVLGVIAHWLVELGELDATFRRSDIAQLKAFVGKDADKIRRPFARGWSDYARRTVFFASVNDKKFLNDPTGSRRFYTLECTAIDHSHQINMQQLWAQIRVEWLGGASHFLTADEVKTLGEQNQKFEQVSPFHDLVSAHFDWGAPTDEWTYRMSATEVVLAVGLKITSNHREPTQMAATLQKFGLFSRRSNYGNFYMMPPRNDKKPHLVSHRIKRRDEH